MKNKIQSISIHCSNTDYYRVWISRSGREAPRIYKTRSSNYVFDIISKLVNQGRLKVQMMLSIYPSFLFFRTKKIK